MQLHGSAGTLPEISALADQVCVHYRLDSTASAGPAGCPIPADVASMVADCLQVDPDQRPTVTDLMSSRYICGEADDEGFAEESLDLRRHRFSQWMRGCARWNQQSDE
jgi:hypothetical protein